MSNTLSNVSLFSKSEVLKHVKEPVPGRWKLPPAKEEELCLFIIILALFSLLYIGTLIKRAFKLEFDNFSGNELNGKKISRGKMKAFSYFTCCIRISFDGKTQFIKAFVFKNSTNGITSMWSNNLPNCNCVSGSNLF